VFEIFLIFVAAVFPGRKHSAGLYIEFLYSYIGGLAEFEWLAAGNVGRRKEFKRLPFVRLDSPCIKLFTFWI